MTTVKADGDDLEFDFKGCPEEDVIKLDEQQELEGGSRCDFVVFSQTLPDLVIEVKDLCQPDARPKQVKGFLREMIVNPNNPKETSLFRKAAVTIAFIQNKWPEKGRLLVITVFGVDCLIERGLFDPTLLGPMQTRLHQRLIAHQGIGVSVKKVRLVTETGWNIAIPHYPLHRISAVEAA